MIDSNSSQQLLQSNFSPPIPEYSSSGHDIDNIEELPSRFKCIFCFLLIRDPIQLTECGHRACRGCFNVRAAATIDGNITCPCDDCHLITNKNQIMPDRAFQRELNVLSIACMYRKDKNCQWIGLLSNYQAHLDETHTHFICPDCKESFPSQAVLADHLKKCPSIFENCLLGPFCAEEMIRKTEFLNHVTSEKHQHTLTKFLLNEYRIPDTSNHEQENQFYKQFEEETFHKLTNLSQEVRRLTDETIQLTTSFETLQQRLNATVQDFNNLYATINERVSIKQSLQPTQEKIQKEIEQAYELYNNNQHISTDGTLTWRIENVSEKLADAQSERQTSIYSPVFYSSLTGYKMRARLFLFGDGNARRTHISLFFLIMKGEYDSILKWPFHYKVTFCLLDQTGNNRHIIDSFYPDVKSNSFQRPKEAANIASGIPKFFPLPMILQDDNAYVRENTLYIKIIIALTETPKTLLPFMLTLNPALPNYVQENLINQEAAKQQLSNTATSS